MATRPNDISDVPQYARRQMLADDRQRKALRANASLPKQAWVGIEDAVYPAMDEVLTIVSDLRDAGLTHDEDVLNKVTEWHKQDYQAEAVVSMDPETETGTENNVEYDLDGSPIPLIHSDFSLGFRETGTAENISTQDGYTMYGLTNHPSVHQGTLGDWTTNPEVIRDNLKDQMARDLKDDEFRPTGEGYMVYVGEDLEDVLDDPDPEGSGDRLIRERIENLNFVGELKTSQFLEPDATLMFRPTRDVVDITFALEEQVVQWEDPFRDYFKTVTAMTPRVKDTLRGQCGIAYYTGGTST